MRFLAHVIVAMMIFSPAGLETQSSDQFPRIAVAKTVLYFDETLRPDQIEWIDRPPSAIGEGMFTSAEQIFGPDGATQRIVLGTIHAGAPVREKNVTAIGETLETLAGLPMSVRTSLIQADPDVEFLSLGDFVDVVLGRSRNGKRSEATIIEGAQIVGFVGSTGVNGGIQNPQRVVISLKTRIEAQKVALARQVGDLRIRMSDAN